MSALGFAVKVNGVPDRGPAVFGVTVATLCLASVFVVARLVSRIGIVRRFSWDDGFVVAAWFLAFALSFSIIWGTRMGLGRYDKDIRAEDRPSLRRAEYAFSILYNPALMATKTSILIFYLRLSKNTKPLLRLASYVVLAIVNLAGVILTFINIFQCKPIHAAYDDVPFQPICIPLLTVFICSAPVNIVTDVAILALPMPVLTSMRLPPRQKTILVMTFALGVFVTVVDVVRIYYLQQAISYVPTTPSSDENAIYGGSPEFSWNASLSLMWSAVEVNVGITCACIPTLKPLIMRILPVMLVDPEGTAGSTQRSQDKDVALSPRQANFGAGGGLQVPRTSHDPQRQSGSDNNSHMTGGGQQHQQPHDENEELNFADFIGHIGASGPGSGERDSSGSTRRVQRRRGTLATYGSANGYETSVYFGFVNIKRPKSMLQASVSDSWKYCTLVTVLFLMWGVSYGLLGTLNNVAALVADMSTAMTLGLTSIYFGGGYFFGPLVVGVWILRHDEHHRSRQGAARHHASYESIGGFKATFMLGLCIYGVGTIMFWPAAVLASFPGFMICNFVVGFGLAVLETAANPFLALCGPPAYAEMRLCLAQGVQAVGSVLSGLLAQHVYFSSVSSRQNTANSLVLIDVQWTYLSVTLLCVALALLFYYIPIPEVTDDELEQEAERLPVDPKKRSIGGLRLATICIILAVVAQWTYVAAQESMSIYFKDLVIALLPPENALTVTTPPTPPSASTLTTGTSGSSTIELQNPSSDDMMTLSVSNYMEVAHAAFAVSRFAAGGLAYLSARHPTVRFFPTPRTVLAVTVAAQLVLTVAIIALRRGNPPDVIVAPIVLFFLAEGPAWPLIFSLGLRGQGRRTKLAAAWLTMGASGPAFWPFVMQAILSAGAGIQTAFIVVAALICLTLAYPVFLGVSRDARALVDPGEDRPEDREPGAASHADEDVNDMLARRRRSRHFSMATTARASSAEEGHGGGGIIERLKRGIGGSSRGSEGVRTPGDADERRASEATTMAPSTPSAAKFCEERSPTHYNTQAQGGPT
ncbi:hypothetical protein RB600_008490 [Gaeumannomyces tritici]